MPTTPHEYSKHITALITFLQRYIDNNVKQSFNDLTFELEDVILEYLNVFEKPNEQFINLNSVKHNYPAIDLENKSKGIAIQVTTNADSSKVQSTIQTFNKHNLVYNRLLIIGFVNATNKSFNNVEVYSSKYLINLATSATKKQKIQLYNILHSRIPWAILTPIDDKTCVEVVLGIVNRSAIRDLTQAEGDYDKMFDGLAEIKEIIMVGAIAGKDYRTKVLSEYAPPIREKLRAIELDVSNIIGICTANKRRNGSQFICFDLYENQRVDDLKREIMDKANMLAAELNLNIKIEPTNLYR